MAHGVVGGSGTEAGEHVRELLAKFVCKADVVGLQLLGAVVVRVREDCGRKGVIAGQLRSPSSNGRKDGIEEGASLTDGGEGLARGRVGLVVDAGDAGACDAGHGSVSATVEWQRV